MRKLILVSVVLFNLFLLSNTGQAGNNPSVSYSHINIIHSLDVMVKSNSLNYLYTQEPMTNDTIDARTNEPKQGKLKSPIAALVIAVVPGVAVHGAGHFYAGNTKKALGLFGAEIIGAGLAYFGAVGMSLTSDTDGKTTDAGAVLFLFGAGLFVGSWIYDVVGSPFLVKSQNENILGKKPFPYEL